MFGLMQIVGLAVTALTGLGISNAVKQREQVSNARKELRLLRDIEVDATDRRRRMQALVVSPFLAGGSSFFADNDAEAASKIYYINALTNVRLKKYQFGFSEFFTTAFGKAIKLGAGAYIKKLAEEDARDLKTALEDVVSEATKPSKKDKVGITYYGFGSAANPDYYSRPNQLLNGPLQFQSPNPVYGGLIGPAGNMKDYMGFKG